VITHLAANGADANRQTMPMVRDYTRRLDIVVSWLAVTASDDQVESVASTVSRSADSLDQVKRRQQLIEALSIAITGVVDVDVKVATNNDLEAVRSDYLKQLRQFLIETLRRCLTGGSIDNDVDLSRLLIAAQS